MSDFWGEDRQGITGLYEKYLPHNATVRKMNAQVDETLERGNRPRKNVKKKSKKKKEVRFHFHG